MFIVNTIFNKRICVLGIYIKTTFILDIAIKKITRKNIVYVYYFRKGNTLK